jgi:hypothetical protein
LESILFVDHQGAPLLPACLVACRNRYRQRRREQGGRRPAPGSKHGMGLPKWKRPSDELDTCSEQAKRVEQEGRGGREDGDPAVVDGIFSGWEVGEVLGGGEARIPGTRRDFRGRGRLVGRGWWRRGAWSMVGMEGAREEYGRGGGGDATHDLPSMRDFGGEAEGRRRAGQNRAPPKCGRL